MSMLLHRVGLLSGALPGPGEEGDFSAEPAAFLTVNGNHPWSGSIIRSGYYDATNDITYVAYLEVDKTFKFAWITGYDHDAGERLPFYQIVGFNHANDAHGAVSICQDADGYLHAFYASHNSVQRKAVSTAPNDPREWIASEISGNVTYPYSLLVGSTIYLFNRDDTTSSRRTLQVRTATPTSGSATFSAKTVLIDLGADSRFYGGDFQAVGTDIHFAFCRATDSAPGSRKGVYYAIYDTTTGDLRNITGGTTIDSADLPMDLTEANADFRLVDHGSNWGDLPCFCRVGSTAHILYVDGSSTSLTLKHISHDGTTQSSATSLATITDLTGSGGFVDVVSCVAGPGGTVEAWYPIDASVSGPDRGGDMRRRVRSSGGTWAAEETIVEADARHLAHPLPVHGGHADLRVFFCEVGNDESDASAATLGLYGHGDSGFLTPPAELDHSVLGLHFNGVDAATSTTDESKYAHTPVFSGNAALSTAQFKFGGSSLRLQPAGYVLVPHHNSMSSLSRPFCLRGWVRWNVYPSSGLAAFMTKWSSVAATRSFIFDIDSGNMRLTVQSSTGGSGTALLNASAAAMNDAAWHHVAASRSGDTWRIFIDGVVVATANNSMRLNDTTGAILFGRHATGTAINTDCWLDGWQMIIGDAVYTGAFTPPAAPF